MLFSRLIPYGCLFALAANAQDSSSSSSSSSSSDVNGDVTILSGVSEVATPTGDYISYSSTLTMSTASPSRSSSAISTEAVVSTVTSGGSTRTTTLGSTTLFEYASLMASNTSGTQSTSTNSQILLSGRPSSTTSINGTSNSTASSTSSSAQPTNTTPCNNYPEFCERKYGNITEVSAHNSPFVKVGNAAANQELPVTTQLNDGIRLLQAQMQWANNTPHFCHTSCDVLDAGPIQDYLTTVTTWVESHPYDVVTILLENGNYSNVELYTPYIEMSGIQNYAYIPPKIPMGINDWPTLASMILTGKRVVIFMDYQANQTAVPWILDEFSQMWETPFDPTNRSFPCDAQRPPNLSAADAKDRLYLVNHNLNYEISLLGNSLLVPNIPLLNVTNNDSTTEFGSLGLNAESCNSTWDYPPKFLNVDYYNVGNGTVFEVQALMNNVTYNRQCCGLVTSKGVSLNEVVGRSFFLLGVCVVSVAWLLM